MNPEDGRRFGNRAAGFTLLEVMVSLMILTLAMALAYGSLTTAITSWSRGLDRGRREQVARIALERMAQQLKSAIPATIAGEGGRRAAFESGEDRFKPLRKSRDDREYSKAAETL